MSAARITAVILLAVFLLLMPVYEREQLLEQMESDRVRACANEFVLEAAVKESLTARERDELTERLKDISHEYSLSLEVGHRIILVDASGTVGDTLYEYTGNRELEEKLLSEGSLSLAKGDIIRAVVTKASDEGFLEESFAWIL